MFSILYVKYQLGHIFKVSFTLLTHIHVSVFEQGWKLFHLTESGAKARKAPKAECMKFIYETGPEKFHDLLTPDWDIARKHRIWDIDGKYLKSLGSPNVNLTKDPIVEFVPGGVRTTTKNYHADVVIFATSFHSMNDLTTLMGETVKAQWQFRTLRTLKFRDEIKATHTQATRRGDDELSVADLDSMKYLLSLIKETLRFHSIVPAIERKS
ncbi:hypothetical protein BU17DRAFT_65715 [Hysterangium stoloniferum]|nr:hypothetical protein BU17DRAFT_65715 [Hysterangium stoloniferum]